MKKKNLLIVIILIIALVAFGFYLYTLKQKGDIFKNMTMPSVNPLENFQSANPFENVKMNPLEGLYKNPFE